MAKEVQAPGSIRGGRWVQEGLEQAPTRTVEKVGRARITSGSAIVDGTDQRIQSHCSHRSAKAGEGTGRANGPHQVSIAIEQVDRSTAGGSAFIACPHNKHIPNDPCRFAKKAASRGGGTNDRPGEHKSRRGLHDPRRHYETQQSHNAEDCQHVRKFPDIRLSFHANHLLNQNSFFI